MIDPNQIVIASTEELESIAFNLDTLITAHNDIINGPEMKARMDKLKIFPAPQINPFILELQQAVNTELNNRNKENE